MKAIIFVILAGLLTVNGFGQSAMQEWPLNYIQKGVETIESVSPRKSRTFYFYDKDGYLVRKSYKNRGKLQTDTKIEYQKSDTSLIVREKEILNNYKNKENYTHLVKKFFFDNEGKYKRFEVYYSEKEKKPFIVGDNFVYRGDLLVSYNRNRHHRKGNITTSRIEHKYNDKNQLIQTRLSDPKEEGDTFIVYRYNDNGRLTDEYKVYPDYLGTFDAASLLGDDFRSDKKMSKKHIVYTDFDASGNWILSVFTKSDGNPKDKGYKRKIQYY